MSTPQTRSIPPAGSELYVENECKYDERTGTRRNWAREPVSWIGLAVIVAIVATFAVLGASFEPGTWYASLAKPELTPADWVFPVVWTALYALMAVSAWLVWMVRGHEDVSGALILFGVQLVLNAAWSWLFFGEHEIGLALADLTALWVALVATIFAFWKHRRIASMLLWPYLVWVTFAGWLNYQLWVLN